MTFPLSFFPEGQLVHGPVWSAPALYCTPGRLYAFCACGHRVHISEFWFVFDHACLSRLQFLHIFSRRPNRRILTFSQVRRRPSVQSRAYGHGSRSVLCINRLGIGVLIQYQHGNAFPMGDRALLIHQKARNAPNLAWRNSNRAFLNRQKSSKSHLVQNLKPVICINQSFMNALFIHALLRDPLL